MLLRELELFFICDIFVYSISYIMFFWRIERSLSVTMQTGRGLRNILPRLATSRGLSTGPVTATVVRCHAFNGEAHKAIKCALGPFGRRGDLLLLCIALHEL